MESLKNKLRPGVALLRALYKSKYGRVLSTILPCAVAIPLALHGYRTGGDLYVAWIVLTMLAWSLSIKLILHFLGKNAQLDEQEVWNVLFAIALGTLILAVAVLCAIGAVCTIIVGLRETATLGIGSVHFMTVEQLSASTYDMNFHKGMWWIGGFSLAAPVIALAVLLGTGRVATVRRCM